MSAAVPEVDAAAGVVRVGAAAWPFELDLHAGAVAVVLDERPYRLRPLSWRDTSMLARFAHLGLPFVKQQFLRLALAGDVALPEGEQARDVLWTLALWINDPAAEAGLPLDPARIAAVSLAVCRATGLKPADLDGRDALEVEQLWRAARGVTAEPVVAAAIPEPTHVEGMEQTRIVVLPDPALEPQAEDAPAAAPLPPVVEAEQASTPEPLPAGLAAAPAPEPEIRAPVAAKPAHAQPAAARRGFSQFRVVYPDVTAGDGGASVASPVTSAAPGHRPPEHEDEHAAAPRGHASSVVSPATIAVSRRDLIDEPVRTPGVMPHMEILDGPPAVRSLETLYPTAPSRTRREERPMLDPVAQPPEEASIVPPFEHPDADFALDLARQDALFDALSARLEQAAAELGIDVEG